MDELDTYLVTVFISDSDNKLITVKHLIYGADYADVVSQIEKYYEYDDIAEIDVKFLNIDMIELPADAVSAILRSVEENGN